MIPYEVRYPTCSNHHGWESQVGEAKGLTPTEGHREAATKTIEPLIQECVDQGIPYVTFWAFSTENWKGTKQSSKQFLSVSICSKNLAIKFIREGIKLNILGEVERFPEDIAKQCLDFVNKIQEKLQSNRHFCAELWGGRRF